MNRHAVRLTWGNPYDYRRITATIYVRADSPGQLKGRAKRLQEEYGADSAKILPPQ